MGRFQLREKSTPNYRDSLPQHDPNNAMWPRISAFAKMLHDISWDDNGDEDADTSGYDEQALDNKESVMEGYNPALDTSLTYDKLNPLKDENGNTMDFNDTRLANKIFIGDVPDFEDEPAEDGSEEKQAIADYSGKLWGDEFELDPTGLKELQALVGASPDGSMGPDTLRKLETARFMANEAEKANDDPDYYNTDSGRENYRGQVGSKNRTSRAMRDYELGD